MTALLGTDFIQAMIAGVYKEDMPVAIGSMCFLRILAGIFHNESSLVTYLFRTTGQVLGVSLSGAVLQAVLLQKLRERIQGPDAAEVSGYFQSTICSLILFFFRLFLLFGIFNHLPNARLEFIATQ